jgi:hypothetical protein
LCGGEEERERERKQRRSYQQRNERCGVGRRLESLEAFLKSASGEKGDWIISEQPGAHRAEQIYT